MHHSFKLLSFNSYDMDPIEEEGEDNKKWKKNIGGEKIFMVQMFGINESGETASIFVTGYTPFFYVKVPDNWNKQTVFGFIHELEENMGQWYKDSIVEGKIIKSHSLYNFDAGKEHSFVCLKFRSEAAMKKAKKFWYTLDPKTKENRLDPDGYEYGDSSTYLYEANIPPLLRLFHIREISPSGWVALPKNKCLEHQFLTTSCKYEYTIKYSHLSPLKTKEVMVPYKICSFDIEASSSHGDFPLAKKNYKKLAENIADIWDNNPKDEPEVYLANAIRTAFAIPDYNTPGVDLVYPQYEITRERLEACIAEILKLEPKHCDALDDEDDSEMSESDNEEIDEGENTASVGEEVKKKRKYKNPSYRKDGSIIDVLKDCNVTRKQLVKALKACLSRKGLLPALKGDEVTFIGSTFLKYGDDKPYMNHCVVKGTCSQPKDVENCVIESCKTETGVLLAWKNLIQKENPDIIIGYNIMGFDWNFMYTRAKELGCIDKFLELSRNKRELCYSKKWAYGKGGWTEEKGMESNTIFLASGQHDLKFVKMPGRLQIDLYNYFRREFQLTRYKLDYVAGYFIGDKVNKLEYNEDKTMTKIMSKNLTGLEDGNYVTFEEEAHSTDVYKGGKKFEVTEVNLNEGSFWIKSFEEPDMKKQVRWGLAKDDVTPQDIFRMTNEGPDERAIIAKYCIQDCNLVHHLMRKIDVITGFVEMSSLCSVPLEFLVMRGQGIKLTSYISKKCREKNTLMPVLDKSDNDEGYEGAIVLPPKCDLYLNDPVACVDYSSLYPSSMISENISHDSKVWTKEYDLEDNLLVETGEKNNEGLYIYDNLKDYKYVDITYDTYKWQRKNGNPKAAMEKVKVGYKICRFAQFPEGKAIMPSILEELLAERKRVRKLIPKEKDEFMKNVLDKRQLSIKVTANSMYGQTGAKTSTFYEVDCAASTTATGRKLLTYAQRVIEEAYSNVEVETKCHGKVKVDAEYVYGDTDSVFFKFNPKKLDGTPIIGQEALEITIELAQEAGEMATKFLKKPHDLEYEKTFWPFCLLSKKRYVGMLYELDPYKCKRKSMGIVLKRRDNAPIVKDIYGGVIDILMKDRDVEKAAYFTKDMLADIVDEKFPIDKLIITKSLRSGYKNPKQISHNVLAQRIGKRDPGNKPGIGDRVAYVYIVNPDKKALQGEKIETPEYILQNKIKIDYAFYITNQIMKPLQQVFALVLEKLQDLKCKPGDSDKFIAKEIKRLKKENPSLSDESCMISAGVAWRKKLRKWKGELVELKSKFPDPIQYKKKEENVRNKEVKALIFDEYIKSK